MISAPDSPGFNSTHPLKDLRLVQLAALQRSGHWHLDPNLVMVGCAGIGVAVSIQTIVLLRYGWLVVTGPHHSRVAQLVLLA